MESKAYAVRVDGYSNLFFFDLFENLEWFVKLCNEEGHFVLAFKQNELGQYETFNLPKYQNVVNVNMLSKMKDVVLDFFDKRYAKVSGIKNRHVDISTIYAYLSGRFPDTRMADCFQVVQDICDFCSKTESVYPYPDGEFWTIEELEKYIAWRDENK